MTHRKMLMAAGLIGATLGLQGLAHASPPAPRVHGLTWTVSQTHAERWTVGQPISLLVGVGPSDPQYHGIRDTRPLREASLVPPTVTGWTKPLGVRLAVRW